jgi:phosphoribosylanthranilate isomerase
MQVKICGCRTYDDSLAAVQAGANLLGFNFYPKSPRYISPQTCRAIAAALRRQNAGTTFVGIFVNAPAEFILDTLAYCRLDLAQLHGDEPPELLLQLGDRAFKALRPAGPNALDSALVSYPFPTTTPTWLVDACLPGMYGGAGQTADWSLAARLASNAPILLAGGLNPLNVADAIRQVHPWGVDVASGVESAPGIKDHEMMRLFIKRAKNIL